MLKNSSIATIAAPEFIDVTPCNDLISKCEIKVCYLGENRNHSFINKETAKTMANTLPGVPIVAAYREDIDDFGDHGKVITIEDGEVKFSCKTVPYGFVSPDAKVWFQWFIDEDESGKQVEREYLMTTGYLWTGQYPEIQKVIDEGMPQSMELSDDMRGYWATNNNSGIDFFIINDATFTKLCILGSDVEPCFEGASVTSLGTINNYSNEEVPEFVLKLLEMKKELNYALQNEGGSDMPKEFEEVAEDSVVETEFAAEETSEVPETTFEESTEGGADAGDGATESEENAETETPEATEPAEAEDEGESEEEPAVVETPISTDVSSKKKIEFELENEVETDFVDKKEDEEEEKEEDSDASEPEGSEEKEDKEKYKKPSKNCSLEEVEAKFAETQAELEFVKTQLAEANAELESLRAFKLGIENQRKDAEIAKFHMLSDEDKAEIIEHKNEYTLEEVKSKLAVLYVEKNVNFSSVDGEIEIEEEIEVSPVTTFSLESAVDTSFIPNGWIKAVLDNKNN